MTPADVSHELGADHQLWHARLPAGNPEALKDGGDVDARAAELAVDPHLPKRADLPLHGDPGDVQPVVAEHVGERARRLEHATRHQAVEDSVVVHAGQVAAYADGRILLQVAVEDSVAHERAVADIARPAAHER